MVFLLCLCFSIFQSSLWCLERKVREEKLRGYARPPKFVFLWSSGPEWDYAVFWDQRQEFSDLTLVRVAWYVSRASSESGFSCEPNWCFDDFRALPFFNPALDVEKVMWEKTSFEVTLDRRIFFLGAVGWNGDMMFFAMTSKRVLSSHLCQWR